MDLLSHFWAPLCAIGGHGDRGPNAQICVSVFGASIVPDRPRLMVILTKANYTHDLVRASGTMTITVLGADQVGLLEPLGMRSGRDGDKLTGIGFELTPQGDPYFKGGVGYLRCDVIEGHDLGDSTAFLCAVRERHELAGGEPIAWAAAQRMVGDAFMAKYSQKRQHDADIARALMAWRAEEENSAG